MLTNATAFYQVNMMHCFQSSDYTTNLYANSVTLMDDAYNLVLEGDA